MKTTSMQTLDEFSPRKAFDLAIGLTMPGEKAGMVTIEGEAGPLDREDATRTPIDARTPLETDFTLSAKSEPRAAEQSDISLAIAQCQVRMGRSRLESW